MKKIDSLIRPSKVLLIFTPKSSLSICCALLPKESKIFFLLQVLPGTSRYSESVIQKTRILFSSWHLFSFCGKVILPFIEVPFFKGGCSYFSHCNSQQMNCTASLRLVFHILISFSGDVMDIRRMGDSCILPEITTTLLVGRA